MFFIGGLCKNQGLDCANECAKPAAKNSGSDVYIWRKQGPRETNMTEDMIQTWKVAALAYSCVTERTWEGGGGG